MVPVELHLLVRAAHVVSQQLVVVLGTTFLAGRHRRSTVPSCLMDRLTLTTARLVLRPYAPTPPRTYRPFLRWLWTRG